MLRSLFLVFACVLAVLAAAADEQINLYDVTIEVERDGDILVTETIDVTVEGQQIRRGIFRDLPKYYLDDATGNRLPYTYKVQAVRRDGAREPYERSDEGNAVRLRIGDANRLLAHGRHTYEISYLVKNQVRYFDGHDEVYWNVTGTYWAFPIERARARIVLPDDAAIMQQAGYTGREGATGTAYRYTASGRTHIFETTAPLGVREGLTVSLGFEKGVVAPPSLSDRGWLWWARNGALAILLGSLGGVFWYYWRSFDRVGRDPVKGPVFPRYEPPEGYSPAGVHHIYYRGFRGHKGLIATLMQLGVKQLVEIEVDKKSFGADTTTLTLKAMPGADAGLPADTTKLATTLFGGPGTIVLDGKTDLGFVTKYSRFRKSISRQYGRDYFKWNTGYVVLGIVLSVAAIGLAISQAHNWSLWLTLAILAIVALNGWFMYLMPAPTRKGQDIRTEIEGFRLYLDTAEKLQLNAVEVGSDAPPPMTTARYEAFLPYAVALGVEEPWTRHFERLVPEEAANYHPAWTNMSSGRYGSIGGMTEGIVSGISSGVSSASPKSSGSSGSGGGGFSGGGGGGGGGGGW